MRKLAKLFVLFIAVTLAVGLLQSAGFAGVKKVDDAWGLVLTADGISEEIPVRLYQDDAGSAPFYESYLWKDVINSTKITLEITSANVISSDITLGASNNVTLTRVGETKSFTVEWKNVDWETSLPSAEIKIRGDERVLHFYRSAVVKLKLEGDGEVIFSDAGNSWKVSNFGKAYKMEDGKALYFDNDDSLIIAAIPGNGSVADTFTGGSSLRDWKTNDGPRYDSENGEQIEKEDKPNEVWKVYDRLAAGEFYNVTVKFSDDSGSSGCNAGFGLGGLVLAVLGMVALRRKK